jgi:hypothetical protein
MSFCSFHSHHGYRLQHPVHAHLFAFFLKNPNMDAEMSATHPLQEADDDAMDIDSASTNQTHPYMPVSGPSEAVNVDGDNQETRPLPGIPADLDPVGEHPFCDHMPIPQEGGQQAIPSPLSVIVGPLDGSDNLPDLSDLDTSQIQQDNSQPLALTLSNVPNITQPLGTLLPSEDMDIEPDDNNAAMPYNNARGGGSKRARPTDESEEEEETDTEYEVERILDVRNKVSICSL